jgi:hypothetical protein
MSSRQSSHSQAPRPWQATQRGGKSRSTAIFAKSFSHPPLDGVDNPLWVFPVTHCLSCGKNEDFHVDTALGDDIPQNRRKHSLCVSVPIVTEFSLNRNFATIAKNGPGGSPEYAQSPTRVGLCRASGWSLVRRTLARARLEWPWRCSKCRSQAAWLQWPARPPE